MFAQVPGGRLGWRIIQNARPKRREGAEARPRAGVGAAHFKILLQSDLGKEGAGVIDPVGQRRAFSRPFIQGPVHERAERTPRKVHVAAHSLDKIHRYIESVLCVALITETVLENEAQHARAVGVSIGPHIGASRQKAVGLSLGERRIGEERGGDGLEGEAYPEFGDHVRLAGEIEVRLDRAGAEHHVEALASHLGHIGAHDVVTAFGHGRHLVPSPDRAEAQPKETKPQGAGDCLHLLKMLAGLLADVVHRMERRSRQFELSAGFETYVLLAPR